MLARRTELFTDGRMCFSAIDGLVGKVPTSQERWARNFLSFLETVTNHRFALKNCSLAFMLLLRCSKPLWFAASLA